MSFTKNMILKDIFSVKSRNKANTIVCYVMILPSFLSVSISPTVPPIPIGQQTSYSFPSPSSFFRLPPMCIPQIHQLTSVLISKMSSTGTVESSRPPKVGPLLKTDKIKKYNDRKTQTSIKICALTLSLSSSSSRLAL